MLGKYFLHKLVESPKPVLSEKKCLYQRGKKTPCSLCRDHCPVGAIDCQGSAVIVNEYLCDGCRICEAVCPTGAFLFEKTGYLESLERLHPLETCLVTCGENRKAEHDLIVPCLGGIPWELIAALALQAENRTVFLNISDCWHCFRQRSLWILYRNVKNARLFLERCGVTLSLQAATNESIPKRPAKTISRRDAFAYLLERTKKETVAAVFSGSTGQGEQIKLRRRLQGKGGAPTRAVKSPGELPFKNWQVGESCQACGLCQGVCPQQAWQLTKEEAAVKLTHDAWKCTSCLLCQQLCPGQALTPAPWAALPAVRAETKKNFPLKQCQSCKASTVFSEDSLCLSCRRKERIRANLAASSHSRRTFGP